MAAEATRAQGPRSAAVDVTPAIASLRAAPSTLMVCTSAGTGNGVVCGDVNWVTVGAADA